MNDILLGKQGVFANLVLDGIGNNAAAYRQAYGKHSCSPAQAATEGYRLRWHPRVAHYIAEEQKFLREFSEARRLARIALMQSISGPG